MILNELAIDQFINNSLLVYLQDFCEKYRFWLKSRDKNEHVELSFDQLKGGNGIEKGNYLIEHESKAGRLKDLVYYMVEYWVNVKGNPSNKIIEHDMHVQLCIAAQEIWIEDDELSRKAFGQLSDLRPSSAFAVEWTFAEPYLDPIQTEWQPVRDMDQLTLYLTHCRELYERGRKALDDYQWVTGYDYYQQLHELNPGFATTEVEAIVNLDFKEVEILQHIHDAVKTQIVYDRRLPWDIGNPYQIFAEFGVALSANATMEQLTNTLSQLYNEHISPEQKAILETAQAVFRSEETRLVADAFLCPQIISDVTAQAINQYFVDHRSLPTPEEIIENYPDESSALLLLMDQADLAIAVNKDIQIDSPLNITIVHTQALLFLADAYAQHSLDSWRISVAQWAVAIADNPYWVEWSGKRFETYHRQQVYSVIDNLKEHIIQRLLNSLDHIVGDDEALKYELMLEVSIEFGAVDIVRAVGGIRTKSSRLMWFGPLWMRYFQLEDTLAEFVATYEVRDSRRRQKTQNVPIEELLREIRWCFSYLAKPAILMQGSPSHILQALPALESGVWIQSPDCGHNECPVHGDPPFPVPLYCIYDESFDDNNPAYKAFEDPLELMREDALQLVMAILFRRSSYLIEQNTLSDRDALQKSWNEIMTLATYSRQPDEIRKRLYDLILRLTDHKSPDSEWFDTPVAILEIGLSILGQISDMEQPLQRRLAKLLVFRGQHKHENKNLNGAEVDLKRAIALAPHQYEYRIALANIWMKAVSDVHRIDRFRALEYLRKIAELIEAIDPNYRPQEFESVLKWVEETRMILLDQSSKRSVRRFEDVNETPQPLTHTISDMSRLIGEGHQALQEKRFDHALDKFQEALNIAPDNTDALSGIQTTVLAYAWWYHQENRYEDGLRLIQDWKEQLRGQLHFEEQLVFYQHWNEIKVVISPFPDYWKYVDNYRRLRLPYWDDNEFQINFQIFTDIVDNNLRFSAVLPEDFSASEVTRVLRHMLQVTRSMNPYKICASGVKDLRLEGNIPLSILSPELFLLTYFAINKYLDIPHEMFLKLEDLEARYREIRPTLPTHLRKCPDNPGIDKLAEQFAKTQRLPGRRLSDVHYIINRWIPDADVHIEDMVTGVKVWCSLGIHVSSTQSVLMNLAKLNHEETDLKLTLDNDLAVILSIETPCLIEGNIFQILDQLKGKASRLRQQIAYQPNPTLKEE